MPEFRIPLVTNEYYHIFNRGVARQPIFLSNSDYKQGLMGIQFYQASNPPMKLSRFKELSIQQKRDVTEQLILSAKSVEVIAFALMPNHFHFLLKQLEDNGISAFVSKFTNSYTRYFNTKYGRVGPLLQGLFKAVYVENDEQLLHLSRYIHLNPVTSHVIKEDELVTYKWTSLPSIVANDFTYVKPAKVLNQFPSTKGYVNFVRDNISYSIELHKIKHALLENDE